MDRSNTAAAIDQAEGPPFLRDVPLDNGPFIEGGYGPRPDPREDKY